MQNKVDYTVVADGKEIDIALEKESKEEALKRMQAYDAAKKNTEEK